MEITTLLSRASDSMHVSRSFGPATDHGGVTIIPVAIVAGGGGGGTGTEAVAPSEDDAAADREVQTMGTGGGFGTLTWPLGVYVVEGSRVRWVPAVDATRIVLAALGLIKVVAALRAKTRRGRS